MAFDIQPGDECVMTGDFSLEGKQAFKRGDIVKIAKISYDRLQPGNKYVANSAALGAPVRLPGVLLKRISCPMCRARLEETKPGVFSNTCDCGWHDPESGEPRGAKRVMNFKEKLETERMSKVLGAEPAAGAADDAEKPRLGYMLHDIVVDGITAFKEGDYVKVEDENPDPSMPEYRYAVYSKPLRRYFLLSDKDFKF